jgi:predicted transcriptional regulator
MADDDTADGSERRKRGPQLIAHTAHLASSYVSHNHVSAADVPTLIRNLFAALTQLEAPTIDERRPAVSIKKSYADDHIICLEDGQRLTMLKRYLKTHHNMSPQDYRAKWGLPPDYPMVAPAYARLRSAFAKRIGLGTKPTSRSKRRPKK